MSNPTNDEINGITGLVTNILDDGITVSMNKGDLPKVFASVIVANLTTYLVINGTKAVVKKVAKRRIKLVVVKPEEDNN